MTELEKLKRAKLYMDKLANGIDPLSDAELQSDSALNNVRLSRCFFYVSDILRQVIDNDGTVGQNKRPKRIEFDLPAEKRTAFAFSREPVSISDFVARLNGMIDAEIMKKFTTTAITDWMIDKGFLAEMEFPNGRKSRQPTKQGEYIGLSTQLRQGQYGDYNLVIYSEDAQRFIMDNLDAILQRCRNKRA